MLRGTGFVGGSVAPGGGFQPGRPGHQGNYPQRSRLPADGVESQTLLLVEECFEDGHEPLASTPAYQLPEINRPPPTRQEVPGRPFERLCQYGLEHVGGVRPDPPVAGTR